MPGFNDLHQHLAGRQHETGSLVAVAASYKPASGAAATPFKAIIQSGGEEQDRFGATVARSQVNTITVPDALAGLSQDRITITEGPFSGTTWIVQHEIQHRPGNRDLHCTRQGVVTP